MSSIHSSGLYPISFRTLSIWFHIALEHACIINNDIVLRKYSGRQVLDLLKKSTGGIHLRKQVTLLLLKYKLVTH